VDAGVVVIAGGGGGVPVAERAGRRAGVPAVIDKDLVSSLLASALGARTFIIATAVERVALAYGTAQERPLDVVTVAEAERYLAAGEFPPGSMGPKVEAMLEFVRATGGDAVITHLDRIRRAYQGKAGTRFVERTSLVASA
jgi:carbamate kinase